MSDTFLILVVEDDSHSCRIAVSALEHAGFRCAQSTNVREALVELRQELPDLVVMDLNLPVVDGLQLTRWLKGDPLTCKIPILAVTAYAMPEDVDIVREAGCDGYLTKPYAPRVLIENVRRLLDASPRRMA